MMPRHHHQGHADNIRVLTGNSFLRILQIVRQPSPMWCDDTRILQSNTTLPSHDSPCFVNCWQIKMIIIHLSCEIKSCVGVAVGVNIINVYNLISHHLNSSSLLMLFSSTACKARSRIRTKFLDKDHYFVVLFALL